MRPMGTGLVGARLTMHIRPIRPSELKSCDTLASVTGQRLNFEEEHARSLSRIWVATLQEDAPEPDAFLLVWVAADELHVIGVGTRPEAQRRGLGRALVTHLFDHARATQSRLILLEVRRSNRAAIALYRSFGFSVARLRKGYYSQPEEDGIEMLVTLDAHGKPLPLADEVPNLEV